MTGFCLAEAKKTDVSPRGGARVRHARLAAQMERSHGVHGCPVFLLVTAGPEVRRLSGRRHHRRENVIREGLGDAPALGVSVVGEVGACGSCFQRHFSADSFISPCGKNLTSLFHSEGNFGQV